MYDQAKMEVARGELKVERIEYKEKHLLPLNTSDLKISAPPMPDPFPMAPLSATSATEKNVFDEPPRRRSSSFTEKERPLPPQLHANWNLRTIREMTPPVTPRRTSPVQPGRENKERLPNGQRRKYSGSTHALQSKGVNGIQRGIQALRIELPPEGIDEKASWE